MRRIYARALAVAVLIVVTVTVSASPNAEAQDTSPYLFPDRSFGDASAADTPCPDGLSVIYRAVFTNSTGGESGLRYCSAPAGYVPVTSETDCLAAEPSGNWVEDANFCFVGGNAAPVADGGLTKATDCPALPDEFFFENVRFAPGSEAPWDLCGISLYRLAPTVLSVTPSSGVVQNMSVVSTDLAPGIPNGSTTVAASSVMPYGLIEFTITGLQVGEQVTVMLNLSPLPAGATAPTEYWKLQNGAWYQLDGAVLTATTATITLQDGGAGDADGIANGTIVDPGGPAVGPLGAAPSGLAELATPTCIESELVQGDAGAADLGVGAQFRGAADGVLYQIVTGGGCAFNCADGFDANCDGRLGDVCPVEFDVRLVKGAAQCLAHFSTASATTPASAPTAAATQPVASAAGSELAHTGGEIDLVDGGLAALGLGASALALSIRIRRRRA